MEFEPYVLHLDESLRAPYLGLGGFISRQSFIPEIERSWGEVKKEMGLDPSDELKWNLQDDHASRIALQGTKWDTQAERAHLMTTAISNMEIVAVCDVLVDSRDMKGRGALDFYRHALTWVLGRFASFLIDERVDAGPHLVVADYPPEPREMKDPELKDDPAYAWLSRKQRIAFDVYTDAYRFGFPKYRSGPPDLERLGFYPSLLTSHADINPLLQIADIFVGATTQCVKENLTGYRKERRPPYIFPTIVMQPQVGDTSMPTLWTRFRGYSEEHVVPYGFTLFPSSRVEGGKELMAKMNSWCAVPQSSGI